MFIHNLEATYFFSYSVVAIYLGLAVFVAILLAGLSVLLRFSPIPSDLLVASAYECGFLPFDKVRSKFEVNFFVVGLLFVIFDLEVIFIFPWSVSLGLLNFVGYLAMAWFLIILGLGFVYEITVGALNY